MQQLAAARRAVGAEPGEVLTLPLVLDGAGSFVAQFLVDGVPVSGVVDTGSPFVTVQRCDVRGAARTWGCATNEQLEASGFETTYEVYGLQVDGSTEWRVAELELQGEGNSSWRFGSLVLGVTSDVSGERGSTAPFVGLVKDKKSWIRPTFLGQTDISGFRIDFFNRELQLMRGQILPPGADAVPLVDMRPLNAPVAHYAARVSGLRVNGEDVRLDRPTYAVFDTGVTGLLVSRELYEGSPMQDGVAECALELPTESGASVEVASSIRTCRRECLLVVRPVDVQWAPGEYNVLFVGLAFMLQKRALTIDADAFRMLLEDGEPA